MNPQPEFTGRSIEVRYTTNLRDHAGNPAHAATHIARRVIELDEELRQSPAEHARILLHEQFHFVWVRLGNPARLEWEELLRGEWNQRVGGEAGWSAEWRKHQLRKTDLSARTQAWREYCCESFCDTAAWIFSGIESELTLRALPRARRRRWINRHLTGRRLPI